jgi:hypothetical protein
MISIRPAYDRSSRFIGFCIFRSEPVGKAFANYKHAALLLNQLRSL